MAAIAPSAKSRRPLRFETFDEVLSDADALAEAERAGALTSSGNWTLGQVLGHLASWASYPFDGYPPMHTPWLLRKLSPLFKNRILDKKMPAGMQIPGVPGGTFGIEPLATDEGLARLRAAFARLGSQAPTVANPIFGPMTHDEWIKLNLRHAELHLSFFSGGQGSCRAHA